MHINESGEAPVCRQLKQITLASTLACLLAAIPLHAQAEYYWYEPDAPAPQTHYASGNGACYGAAQRILSSYQAGSSLKHRIQALSASDVDGSEYICSVTIYKKQLSMWLPVIVGQTFSVFQAGAPCPVTGRGDANGYCGAKQPRNECNGSNPILGAFGAKYQHELDFGAGQLVPLSFGRHYNHLATEVNSMGAGWRNEYERKLVVDDVNLNSTQFDPTSLTLQRQDGTRYRFTANGSAWTADPDIRFRVTRLTDAETGTTGWRVRTPDGLIEAYNATGDLTSVTQISGAALTLSYDTSHRLKTLGDTFGRAYTLGWDASNRINKVNGPDGVAYSYGYDGQGDLTSVTYPNGTATGDTRNYVYNEAAHTNNNVYPHFLTGIVEPGNKRFATFKYDSSKRAVMSTHAGGAQQTSFAYTSDIEVQITGALGSSSTFTYTTNNGVRLIASRTQAAGAGCAASSSKIEYDANGNKALEDDFNGNRTCFVSTGTNEGGAASVPNLLKVKIEGLVGTTGASAGSTPTTCADVTADGAVLSTTTYPGIRKTSTQWHPQWALKVKEAQPNLITTWVYNGQPDPFNGGATARCVTAKYGSSDNQPKLPDDSDTAVLCKKVEQATTDATGEKGFAATLTTLGDVKQRQWTYTYNQFGQVLTSTDPMGQVTTYTYWCEGQATCDGTNKFVFTGTAPNEVGHYQGDLWKVTNAAGHITEYVSYDRAGRVLEMKDANGLQTKLSYSPRGWVTEVNTGGLKTSYDYWPTGLLKKSTQPDGSYLYYRYDDAHRLTSVSDQVDGDGNPTGNTVTYTLDAMGNRKTEQLNDASNTITRHIQRDYDALNRLQNITGALQ